MDQPDNDHDYEQRQLMLIREWRDTPPSIVSEAIGKVAAPVAWVVSKVIPTSAVEGALRGADWLARSSTRDNWAILDAGVADAAELCALPLRRLDGIADGFHNNAIRIATGEGVAAGAFGIFGMVVDVPAVITLALRTIRGIGRAYGYDADDDAERQFALGVLSAAGANSIAEKAAALAQLQALKVTVAKVTFKQMAKTAASRPVSNEAAVLAIRGVARQLGVNLTKRKIAQAIPYIGAAVGGAVNGAFIGDVGWAARRAYQARLLEDRGVFPEPA